MVVRYDPATGCTGGPKPGAIALRDHWRTVTGLTDLGIYNCRRIRGGSGFSVHSEGRAVDLAADAHTPQQADAAERYCHFLIEASEDLQMQLLIWNRRQWRSGRGWTAYDGVSPHTDHVHVELNRTGATTVTDGLLARLWTDRTATKPATEDDEMYAQLILFAYREAKRDPNADPKGVTFWLKQLDDGDPMGVVNKCRAGLGLPAI